MYKNQGCLMNTLRNKNVVKHIYGQLIVIQPAMYLQFSKRYRGAIRQFRRPLLNAERPLCQLLFIREKHGSNLQITFGGEEGCLTKRKWCRQVAGVDQKVGA
jgi:hypothetical protein